MLQLDILIIGSGLAGPSLVLELADQRKIAVITKKSLLVRCKWTQDITDTDDRWKMPADKHFLTDINRFLLIRHGEVLTPFGLSSSKPIHLSTGSRRTDFKHNLAESIGLELGVPLSD